MCPTETAMEDRARALARSAKQIGANQTPTARPGVFGPPELSCPLCGSATEPIADLATAPLIKAYRRSYDVDIQPLFAKVPLLRFRSCGTCGLRCFLPLVAGDGKFYETLRAWYARHVPKGVRHEGDLALSFIRPGMAVLEVGCGECPFHDLLPAGVDYVGLELNPAAAAAGRERGVDVREQLVDRHAADHPDQYDVVCFFQVLEHVVDIPDFLRSSLLCLKPGGMMIISVPNSRGFLGYQVDNILNMPPHHLTWWAEGPLRRIGVDHELELIAIAEDDLAPDHTRDFFKVLAMTLLRRSVRARSQFELDGISYRLRRYLSAALARVLAPCLGSNHGIARGHSITAVFRKRPRMTA